MFQNRFFRWVDCPECERCGAKTERDGSGEPTPAELQFGGARVELYRCTVCAAITRFPRFNHPGQFTETSRQKHHGMQLATRGERVHFAHNTWTRSVVLMSQNFVLRGSQDIEYTCCVIYGRVR